MTGYDQFEKQRFPGRLPEDYYDALGREFAQWRKLLGLPAGTTNLNTARAVTSHLEKFRPPRKDGLPP